MSEMAFFQRLATTERMILYSLAGVKILRIVSRIFAPLEPSGLVYAFPSMVIAVMVLEIRRMSSCQIAYSRRAFSRILSNDSASILLIISSISSIVIALFLFSRIYCVVMISESVIRDEKDSMTSSGMVSKSLVA